MKKKQMVGIAVLGLCVVTAGTGWSVYRHKAQDQGENAVYVNTVEQLMNPMADMGGISRFSGVVETQKQVKIQPEQERTVKEVFVEEGQEVTKGTVLFSYDIEEEKNKLSQLQLEAEKIENDIEVKRSTVKAAEKTGDALEILQAQTELKQSEFEKETKNLEIEKLNASMGKEEVKSQIDGIVKSVHLPNDEAQEEDSSLITLIALGNFRVKGKVNEQNISSITEGQHMLLHSRLDESRTWKGHVTELNEREPDLRGRDGEFEESLTNSSSYFFYVELDSTEGLMLGQHLYMEADYGQGEQKDGIWLDESFVVTEEDTPFVWAEDEKGRLEKRKVNLGEHDEELYKVEIKEGLKNEDRITFPEPDLKEGMKVLKGGSR